MRSRWLIAVLHPLNIGMVVGAIMAGLISAWWLFPLGMLLWFIMVMNVANDPAVKLNVVRGQRSSLSQRFQPLFERVERSQLSVFNNMSNTPTRMRKTLQPIQEEIENVVNTTYSLCHKMATLDNYRRVSELRNNVQNDLRQIERIIAQTEDPLVRQDYEATKDVLQSRLDDQKSLNLLMERVEAQLLNLSNEMDRIVADVLRLQSLGEQEARAQSKEIVEKLRQEAAELTEFEQQALKQHRV